MPHDLHVESLTRLVNDSGGTFIPLASAIFAAHNIAASQWSVSRSWTLFELHVAWLTTVRCRLEGSQGPLGSLEFRLPWLLDDAARISAPADESVGGHEGLYVGRPLVPVAQWRDAPGVHVRWKSPASSLDPDLEASEQVRATVVVVPEHGGGLFVNDCGAPRPLGLPPVWLTVLRRLRDAGPEAAFVPTEVGVFACQQVDEVHRAFPRFFSQGDTSLDDEVRDLIAADRARRGAGSDAHPYADAVKYAPERSVLRGIGDHLAEAVTTALLVELTDAPTQRSAAGEPWFGPWLTSRISGRIARWITDSGALATVPDTDNTLALTESGRVVTAFGPYGLLPPVRGSLDFRDLHPGWRGALCPIHTPESEDISLIRYRATGDLLDADLAAWRDLSWSGALIPYVNHDEQARAVLAAKNLKQAVPLEAPRAPRIRTGVESALAERAGVLRAPRRCRVETVAVGRVTILTATGGRQVLPFGPPRMTSAGPARLWIASVEPGAVVERGAIVAHAPDVVVEADGRAHLALGRDLMVAVTPWHGLNFEDAIVLRESAAGHLAHVERFTFTDDLGPMEWLDPIARPGDKVAALAILATVRDADGAVVRDMRTPYAGVVRDLRHDRVERRALAGLDVRRPLEVGDKLTNRHGGKGVVSRILPDAEMPRLPDGTLVDAITSPAGIVRRLNVGQAHEMAVGLLAHLEGRDSVRVGRRFTDRAEVAAALAGYGAAGGRLPLTVGGEPFGAGPILVGPQYFLKLHHLAAKKLSVRQGGAVSVVTGQPTQGSGYRSGVRVGSGQRLGEMELWALQARGATELVRDALWARGSAGQAKNGVRPAFVSLCAHLAAMGLLVTPGDAAGPDEPAPAGFPTREELLEADAFAVVPSRWDILTPMVPADFAPRAVTADDATRQRPDGDSHWFHDASLADPDDARRVARCLRLPVAYAPGGRPRAVIPDPGEDGPATLNRRDADALVRLAGAVMSHHAWITFPRLAEAKAAARAGRNAHNQAVAEVAKAGNEPPREPSAPRSKRAGAQADPGNDLWDEESVREHWRAVASRWLADRAVARTATRGRRSPSDEGGESRRWSAEKVAALAGEAPVAQWADAAGSLEWLLGLWSVRLPILPAAYRVRGRDRLDVLYERLARALQLHLEPLSLPSLNPRRILGLVYTIIGGVDEHAPALACPSPLGVAAEPTSLAGRLEGKTGLLRGGLLGTTTFYSGRGVIVPDPGRPIDRVGLPSALFDAIVAGDRTSGPDDPTRDVVYIVRQPTLRPANIIALGADRVDGHAIVIHPDLCEALAGDFDGDTVAVHRPRSAAARAEAVRLFGAAANVRNPAGPGFLVKADLDLALGRQLLAGDPSQGEAAPVTAGLEGLPADEVLGAIRSAQEAAWEAATGWSPSFVDLPRVADDDHEKYTGLAGALASADPDTPLGPLGTLHRAGAAGKLKGLAQLLVARGVQHGFNPLLGDQDIAGCFLDGLTDEEFFVGARAGAARLAEKKLLTPHAGGFTKLLAEICYEVEVSGPDCGSGAARRTPLTCLASMPCAACIGTLPNGHVPQEGERIGLLAAMLVGERSTQLAMKTFHGGGSDGVDLTTLRALTGYGSSRLLGRLLRPPASPLSLSDYLDSCTADLGKRLPSSEMLAEPLAPVVQAIVDTFSGAVAAVYPQVILKQLVEVWREMPGRGLAGAAKSMGRDPVVVATIHGSRPEGGVPDQVRQTHRLDILLGRTDA